MGNPFPFLPQFPHLRASAPQQSQPPTNPPHHYPTFRAPAHKHAHHLHSIPPREKSTRTLIIDHMLWVHARTRSAQARAELGMTDRTGGPSSPNYTHRRRPENYDEEDEVLSEGEDLLFLQSRSGWPGPTHDDDDADHLSKQDLALARNLRLRAEGLESVISSMLDQPPPHHPQPTDDGSLLGASPASPKGVRTGSHPHTLPNGVRFRLALGTVINDLFARQLPPQPFRHTHPPKHHEESHSNHPHHSAPDLPEALLPLVPLSGAFTPDVAEPSTSFLPYGPASGYTTQPINITNTHLYTPTPKRRPVPSDRTLSYYTSGADPSTANSPPSLRCPRHLHTGCEICVEAKSTPRPTPTRTSPYRQPTKTGKSSTSPSSGSSSSNNNNNWKAMPSSGGTGVGVVGMGGGISGWQDGSGIGSGLLRPAIKGSALRRCVYDGNGDKGTGAGNTKLSKLIPRFLRLSALVAEELGQEARDEWESAGNTTSVPSSPVISRAVSKGKEREEDKKEERRMRDNALSPTREWYMLLAGLLTRAVLEGYLTAGWRGAEPAECLLLVGMGIGGQGRGVLGVEASVDGIGAGRKDEDDGSDDDNDGDGSLGDEEAFAEFDPDGLPSLPDAIRVLFPSLNVEWDGSLASAAGRYSRKGQAEAEYEAEMYERLRRFYDIPDSTPDLSTHMEDLAWSYPAEPVERAAIRFCEAVAKWRGKPELETYKKKTPSSPGMSIDSLVHSNPASPVLSNAVTATPYTLASLSSMLGQTSQPAVRPVAPAPRQPRRQARKPSIDVYFAGVAPRSGMKRGRDEREVEGREGVKRMHM
ncbi:hypothetical protein P691DRAFT_760802 [Macrolepiota fuliginosa MF-IS2]|uniref:Uncharacterized protein n=1 Tax=Macrolepiota fuliginosa MF-IS2 TaxID=1400762 RepID=A0A9P6C365_9AGAR|nr:hypothetical protein P691DRAFT_760802 [Macrolepiota fuliginosa MF-IS2]